jgi:hypothetical protein
MLDPQQKQPARSLQKIHSIQRRIKLKRKLIRLKRRQTKLKRLRTRQ